MQVFSPVYKLFLFMFYLISGTVKIDVYYLIFYDLQAFLRYLLFIIFFQQIDCRELRQSSPLSQVVPPKSKACLPIVFESNVKGKFQRYDQILSLFSFE